MPFRKQNGIIMRKGKIFPAATDNNFSCDAAGQKERNPHNMEIWEILLLIVGVWAAFEIVFSAIVFFAAFRRGKKRGVEGAGEAYMLFEPLYREEKQYADGLEKRDNYLTTADAVKEKHTVLASQFLNEQFAAFAGIPEEQMGLGHAFEIDPSVKNGFLMELAQAQMAREIFPKAPLKYMPPTKYMTGNIFRGHIQDALFNIVTITTNQKLHLLGMMTEALHTPFMSDRALAIENAQYVFNTMADLGKEIEFKKGGFMQQRAQSVLAKTVSLLEEIERNTLFVSLSRGVFADIKRPPDGGKGLDGVVAKEDDYFNPFIEIFLKNKTADKEEAK